MTETYNFPATTANYGLPLLFAGQTQKEFFVNHSFAMLDRLVRHAVESAQVAPPATASEGDCYLVAAPAVDSWEGQEDCIAMMVGGAWQFLSATEGQVVFNIAESRFEVFKFGWQSAALPPAPTGGANVDTEARAVIAEILDQLQKIGISA